MIRIGTAGWAIPRAVAERFPREGSGLERYAARFDCAEINATFYRPPRPSTLERWAETVPRDFRFSTKLSREITHVRRLVDCGELLERALAEVEPLGQALGPLLIQLPPSLAFERGTAERFFRAFRALSERDAALEPRHPSWFSAEADALLAAARIARVAADPARAPEGATPGGWPGLVYARLHGSPRTYWSTYAPGNLVDLAGRLGASDAPTWCIFDNTASGAAAANALDLQALLGAGERTA